MEAALIVAFVGIVLLAFELLLSTGGVLAALGAIGLMVAGVLALESSSSAADVVGPALIVLGLLSIVAFWFITRKVIEAHRGVPARTGSEELVGSLAEVRSTLDPEGQVFAGGTVWGARLGAGGDGPARLGDRVRIESIDGLTLVVRREPPADGGAEEGAG
jgi:membrane-bound serine protease (ClpP class)